MDSNLKIRARMRLTIGGGVQGVGFRPFIYRLAVTCDLSGWVMNTPRGVTLEVEGDQRVLEDLIPRISREKPSRSFIQSVESVWIPAQGEKGFEIRGSDTAGEAGAFVLPDMATCPDCISEIFDPKNRRYAYPFTNCTQCGPRYSIIASLPYDRPNTTMGKFVMCGECQREYDDPLDRRFHAQPNACPHCGPHLEWWDREGKVVSMHHEVIDAAVTALGAGAIIALKGLGGFQLLADARNTDAVERLRIAKHREEKPFAIMEPSLHEAMLECEISDLEKAVLCSAEAPIVLLKRRRDRSLIAGEVAPGNPFLGVMLPYTPLHHLLMRRIGFPVVATSGNRSDEPICIDEHDALVRLRGIADFYLVHDRPILRHVDDSIVRVMMGRISIMRRARGYAPLPLVLNQSCPSTLAVGGHMKNTVALSVGKSVFVSQHLGDLGSALSLSAFHDAIADLQHFYAARPEVIAADTHPDYLSAKRAPELAADFGVPLVAVQHHLAHVLSCMVDNEVMPPVLGVAWDGTGYGEDGTIWGGEFLKVTVDRIERFAHLRNFSLPGGEVAMREPRRCALGLLYTIYGEEVFGMTDLAPLDSFSTRERDSLRTMLRRHINAPLTSSMGRLFDAVASLIGIRQKATFEGQAAMECEWIATECQEVIEPYPLPTKSGGDGGAFIIDWEPMIRCMVASLRASETRSRISARFHRTLTELVLEMAQRSGFSKIVLSGGCFQNELLLAQSIHLLQQEGHTPLWHQRVPPNDGGISLGQIAAVTMGIPNHWKNA